MPRPPRYRPKNPLDGSLQRRFPKKRKKEIYRLFKEFIQTGDNTAPKSPDEADAIISRWQNDYVNHMGYIEHFTLPDFADWCAQRTYKLYRKRGKKGSDSRWPKP